MREFDEFVKEAGLFDKVRNPKQEEESSFTGKRKNPDPRLSKDGGGFVHRPKINPALSKDGGGFVNRVKPPSGAVKY